MICACAAAYTALIAVQYQSYRVSQKTGGWAKAARLDPWNSEYPYLIGHKALFADQDVATAIPNLRRAAQLNPNDARYWLDLALSYEISGDVQGRQEALDKAGKVQPSVPEVAWEIARFYLVQGENDLALSHLKVAMYDDPQRSLPAVEMAWRALHDTGLILDHLPPIGEAYNSFLTVVLKEGNSDAAKQIWDRLVRIKAPLPAPEVFPYIDYLLDPRRRDVKQASKVWRDLAQLDPRLTSYTSSGNLIVNGGFEEEILDGGFDWRSAPPAGVKVGIDTDQVHRGGKAFFISFTGQAVSDAGLWQYIPVEPDKKYEFSVFVQTDRVEGANGPRISIADAFSRKPLALTEELKGSAGWHEETAEFQTPPETQLLLLTIVRDPASTVVEGNLWIDDFTLTPAATSSHP